VILVQARGKSIVLPKDTFKISCHTLLEFGSVCEYKKKSPEPSVSTKNTRTVLQFEARHLLFPDPCLVSGQDTEHVITVAHLHWLCKFATSQQVGHRGCDDKVLIWEGYIFSNCYLDTCWHFKRSNCLTSLTGRQAWSTGVKHCTVMWHNVPATHAVHIYVTELKRRRRRARA
jgi:hypothetical protein